MLSYPTLHNWSLKWQLQSVHQSTLRSHPYRQRAQCLVKLHSKAVSKKLHRILLGVVCAWTLYGRWNLVGKANPVINSDSRSAGHLCCSSVTSWTSLVTLAKSRNFHCSTFLFCCCSRAVHPFLTLDLALIRFLYEWLEFVFCRVG